MIEILPNWHPVFVHFTVALFTISVLLFVMSLFIPKGALKSQFVSVATWNLWIGGLLTAVTLIMGWLAYNSVGHDSASHAQMTTHKDWAFIAAGMFGLLIVWSFLLKMNKSQPGILFVALALGSGGVLAIAAYHGGEAVYRYGLGVKCLPDVNGTGKKICLPKAKSKGHSHKHAPGQGHGDQKKSSAGQSNGSKTETKSHGSDGGHTRQGDKTKKKPHDNSDGHSHGTPQTAPAPKKGSDGHSHGEPGAVNDNQSGDGHSAGGHSH
ncbi:hypothetical protein MNBD_GAMMA12-998 [hydrothermal vent metagenome]|uniref:DUF2231 domain-containing protein n=1 Tax=hydrothermal vent metagenome TaxID=652676 RepID=A0A3B0YE22_9ZZZZ